MELSPVPIISVLNFIFSCFSRWCDGGLPPLPSFIDDPELWGSMTDIDTLASCDPSAYCLDDALSSKSNTCDADTDDVIASLLQINNYDFEYEVIRISTFRIFIAGLFSSEPPPPPQPPILIGICWKQTSCKAKRLIWGWAIQSKKNLSALLFENFLHWLKKTTSKFNCTVCEMNRIPIYVCFCFTFAEFKWLLTPISKLRSHKTSCKTSERAVFAPLVSSLWWRAPLRVNLPSG